MADLDSKASSLLAELNIYVNWEDTSPGKRRRERKELRLKLKNALKAEGDRRAEEMRGRCVEACKNVSSSVVAEHAIRSLPLEPNK
jgi:hypothetical protein